MATLSLTSGTASSSVPVTPGQKVQLFITSATAPGDYLIEGSDGTTWMKLGKVAGYTAGSAPFVVDAMGCSNVRVTLSNGPGTATVNVVPFDSAVMAAALTALYDPHQAIREWWRGRGAAAVKRQATLLTGNQLDGMGGVDICYIGDSLTKGQSAYRPEMGGFVNRVREAHQRWFSVKNPNNGYIRWIGGYGFAALMTTQATMGSNWSAAYAFNTSASYPLGSNGTAITWPGAGVRNFNFLMGPSSSADPRLNWQMLGVDSTEPVNMEQGRYTSDFEIVGASGPSLGTVYIDVGTSWPERSGGTMQGYINGGTLDNLSGTWNQNAGSWSYGVRSARYQLSANTTTYYVAARPGSTGSPVLIDGIISYYNDWKCGFRHHNLGAGGCRLTYYDATNWAATLGAFCAGTTAGGATNCKLVVIKLGTNDMGADGGAVTSAATFQAALLSRVTETLAMASNPMVLLIVPLPINGGDAVHATYRSAIYAVQAMYPSDVAVLDFFLATGSRTNAQYQSDGIIAGDGVHLTEAGHSCLAELLMQMLIS